MSNLVHVLFKDNRTRKDMRYLITTAMPRDGETIFIDGVKWWVEAVEWHMSSNTIHKDEYNFEGITVIIDTAERRL
jgi:hypothetical protein